jgi:hypothetical protein
MGFGGTSAERLASDDTGTPTGAVGGKADAGGRQSTENSGVHQEDSLLYS